jgi:VanZ family protein
MKEKFINNKKSIILWMVVVLWMVLIYRFSAQVADESNKLSTGVTEIVIETVEKIAPEFDFDTEALNGIIRKNAHFLMYFLLGIFVFSAIGSNVPLRQRFVAALLICSLYAATDEVHQMFVPGRGPAVMDVFIDSSGTCMGILVYLAVGNIFFKNIVI